MSTLMQQSEKKGCLGMLLGMFNPKPSPVRHVEDEHVFDDKEEYPYQKKQCLLTKAEISFFGVLQHAVQGQYHIFPMVRLADLLMVRKGTDGRQGYFNKISRKHIDFVCCDPSSLAPVFCIELDDASHNQQKRQERDAFLNEAMKAAGLPLLRVPAQRSYNVAELVGQINALLVPQTPHVE